MLWHHKQGGQPRCQIGALLIVIRDKIHGADWIASMQRNE
jgi:hypothetical protein